MSIPDFEILARDQCHQLIDIVHYNICAQNIKLFGCISHVLVTSECQEVW